MTPNLVCYTNIKNQNKKGYVNGFKAVVKFFQYHCLQDKSPRTLKFIPIIIKGNQSNKETHESFMDFNMLLIEY